MTKKRFILKENGVIDDTQLNILLDGGEDKEDMVDLLNSLHDENKKLKWILTTYNPQDLPVPSKEKMKEFIDMLYAEEELLE